MHLVHNLKAKASDLAQRHGGKVERGIDKAAKLVDEKTKGKYSDKIHTGTDKAKGAMDRIAHRDAGPAAGGQTPPDVPQPPSAS
ncbi:collagen triple helix repeat-containing protein [Streptomyces hygroscopicus]|uniref:antitoxin n=1 Tax=Streptomyces hygroscopicus TaxID=1912 RepID=UPI0022400965|nr:antitoxin [Streptomyces hygroscopicus]MCW7946222.1 collagen triple helix repeat-containing protein [Streptomyces hygroscopicus]